ncbi:hypothetical protein B0T17DRAFT_509626 [Bombardia bombarda]|uniref:Uncharacterized protein n=1 Tax=Bombardia bombarda TaxID=252184 RepID=A0AA40BY84_9PEZI|nr:hypothetical protein B0T17DRAFT_509626 [Bombardia bombarda]
MAVEYTRVSQQGSEVEEKEDEFIFSKPRPSYLSQVRSRYGLPILVTALVASLCANVFFVCREFTKPWELLHEIPTQFAGLRRDVPTEILAHGPYDSLNRTVQDAAWNHVDVEPWTGFVALDEDYTVAQGLPHSQRWPWDLSKGVSTS